MRLKLFDRESGFSKFAVLKVIDPVHYVPNHVARRVLFRPIFHERKLVYFVYFAFLDNSDSSFYRHNVLRVYIWIVNYQ